jgi:hypothetical protein
VEIEEKGVPNLDSNFPIKKGGPDPEMHDPMSAAR